MLQVHADFNLRYGRRRRVNTFLYVNPDWPDDFGGHLELWDRNMSECRQRISPKLGRFVAFSSLQPTSRTTGTRSLLRRPKGDCAARSHST
jgi:Rps23 Pro-64 3,4-dihydroxylase Tpa1-like proline 4-hydroxylase